MMPQQGLRPAALAGMGRVQGTRFQCLDFFGLKRKRGKLHTRKIRTPPVMRLLMLHYLDILKKAIASKRFSRVISVTENQ